MLNIGETIRSGRIKKGFSQKDFAKKIGIKPSMLSRFENNNSVPTGTTLLKIISELDLVPELFPGYVKAKSGDEEMLAKEMLRMQAKLREHDEEIHRLKNYVNV